jgi:hypothetical protein
MIRQLLDNAGFLGNERAKDLAVKFETYRAVFRESGFDKKTITAVLENGDIEDTLGALSSEMDRAIKGDEARKMIKNFQRNYRLEGCFNNPHFITDLEPRVYAVAMLGMSAKAVAQLPIDIDYPLSILEDLDIQIESQALATAEYSLIDAVRSGYVGAYANAVKKAPMSACVSALMESKNDTMTMNLLADQGVLSVLTKGQLLTVINQSSPIMYRLIDQEFLRQTGQDLPPLMMGDDTKSLVKAKTPSR